MSLPLSNVDMVFAAHVRTGALWTPHSSGFAVYCRVPLPICPQLGPIPNHIRFHAHTQHLCYLYKFYILPIISLQVMDIFIFVTSLCVIALY